MKRKIIIVCITGLILTESSVKAQNTPRRDTVWGGWSNQLYYNSILNAPVATGETQPINIIPNQGPLCFDKKITIKSTVGRTVIEQCLYLDTRGGLLAFLKAAGSTSNNRCEIRPDDENFSFSVIGLKGNAYLYSNIKKNNIMQHWVSTGNTQTYVNQANSNTGTYSLRNKQITQRYYNGKIKATAYKFDSPNSPLLFLFGKTYPPTLNVTANKYIGNFGIGYQYTDRGLYIIMETKSSRFTCEITSIEEVNTCFDPSPFNLKEDEFVRKQRERFLKEREKLDRDEARIRDNDACSAAERNIIVFKKAQLRINEQNLQAMTQGNLIQNQQAQMAALNLMNPLFMIQGDILYTLHSICLTEVAIRERPTENGNVERLSCLQGYLRRLYTTETQMSELDVLHAADPPRAYVEKSRIYRELMLRGCN
jgi:hypothetical protein